MTIKQINRQQFWNCLEAYEQALSSGVNIVPASLAVWIALGQEGVPKKWRRYVTKTFERSEK